MFIWLLLFVCFECTNAFRSLTLRQNLYNGPLKQIDCYGRDCDRVLKINCNSYGDDQYGLPVWECVFDNIFRIHNATMKCTCNDSFETVFGLAFQLKNISTPEELLDEAGEIMKNVTIWTIVKLFTIFPFIVFFELLGFILFGNPSIDYRIITIYTEML